MDASIERAAELIAESQRMVALTGAGISTPSGIPDYRSPKSGLWEQAVDMAEIAQPCLSGFRPVRRGRGCALITQNIDLLHERPVAGRPHGHLRDLVCPACHALLPAGDALMRS
jgi:NAD-dependent deacetylase